MSHEPPNGSHEIRGSKGSGFKWLAGAAVAALLLGGGYYAWTSLAPSSTDVAYNAPLFSEPFHAVALAPNQEESMASGPTDQSPASNAATESRAPAAAPVHRRSTARAAPVPEQVVDITPVSATIQDNDEIVVDASRRPVWIRTPSTRRLSTYYPERALERGREGEASIYCTIQQGGALDCVPVSETPAHAGFGTAAVHVARAFRHAPQRADGSAAAGSPLNLRVVFRISDNDRRG